MRLLFAKLLLLFTVVPLVELLLLLEIGRRMGTLATLLLIVGTGVIGALLAKRQGLGVVRRVQAELAAGQLPAATIVDGVIIVVAGALLITPGVLTDIAGFSCLVPLTRRLIRAMLWHVLLRVVRQGRTSVQVRFDQWSPDASREERTRDERTDIPAEWRRD